MVVAIASRLEAIASRLEAIGLSQVPLAMRLEAIAILPHCSLSSSWVWCTGDSQQTKRPIAVDWSILPPLRDPKSARWWGAKKLSTSRMRGFGLFDVPLCQRTDQVRRAAAFATERWENDDCIQPTSEGLAMASNLLAVGT